MEADQGMGVEEIAVGRGLWLRMEPCTESRVERGALVVPMGLPPEERDEAMARAFAAWLSTL